MHAPETASASNTWLRCYGTESYECSYWPERQARSQVVQSGQELLGNAYSQLIRLGFRRSGLHIYRPHCDHCQACTPLRVDALHFQPSRSQKRAWKRHAHLRARVLTPTWSEESYALYQRYQASRHPGGGMDDGDQEQYAQFLLASRVETRLVEFRDPADDRLVMVSVIDLLDDGLSAVYTYYDPDTPGSLGAYSILWQIAQCQENRRPWLYLGYWIPGHGKMHYKASYTPAQILFEGHWLPFDELPPQHWPGLLATPRQKP